MKLIVLSKPDFFVEEDQILTALFEEGLDLLHLRKPNAEPVLSERLLSLIPQQYHSRIVVHNHFYLKEEYGLRGIHLSHANPNVPSDYRGTITRTCYSLDELSEAKGKYDYVFLDPIYDGISQEHRRSPFNVAQLGEAARKGVIDRKVMASGGISLENLDEIERIGFGGAVVCGDLWGRFDMHSGMDYKALLTHFRKLRKMI